MNRSTRWVVIAAVLGLVVAGACFAQGGRGGGGNGPRYDPKTVVTVAGEVVAVDKVTTGYGRSYGVHLRLKTARETIPVHLGPAWYLQEQGFQVKPKDRVEVKGSRVTFEGKPAIIAAEVKSGERVLKLRDENGIPRWSGGRRRR